jgi:predicted DNA binding CopG/RHH family protein
MPSFKEINKIETEKKDKLVENKPAASKILASHATKDKRVSVRMSSQTYDQFALINSKLGASNGSVINMMVAEYVMKHRDLLSD